MWKKVSSILTGILTWLLESSASLNRYPHVAITLRESLSASTHNWGAMLYEARSNKVFFAPRDISGAYQPCWITHIVDRIGGGGAFSASLIFALPMMN
jgi:hypothetical protein